MKRPCEFCKGTGKHLCPDVAEPILINCMKKGCSFVVIENKTVPKDEIHFVQDGKVVVKIVNIKPE